MSKASDILTTGAKHMRDRASTYDKPEGERSMPSAVKAFNAITSHNLTAEQGWLFMVILKAVRSQQGDFKMDNYEDMAAYAALCGEQGEEDRSIKIIDECSTIVGDELLGMWDQSDLSGGDSIQDRVAKSDAHREGNRITDVDWDGIKYTAEDLWAGDDWQSIRRSISGDWYAHETTDASDPGTKFPNQVHIRAIIKQLHPGILDKGTALIMRPYNLQQKEVDWSPWSVNPDINWVARGKRGGWYGYTEKPTGTSPVNWYVDSDYSEDRVLLPRSTMDKWAEQHDILPKDDWKTTLVGKGDQL